MRRQHWQGRPRTARVGRRPGRRDKAGLTTPFTTQNRLKAARDSIGLHDAIREIASTIRDFRDPEGSGGDARRTSYTLPPVLSTDRLLKPGNWSQIGHEGLKSGV
jgi:hypothetical protein